MRAKRQRSGNPEVRSRPWVLVLLVLTMVWPALLTPAHDHGGPAGPARVASETKVGGLANASPARESESCAVCRELLHTAAYLAPPAPVAWIATLARPAMPLATTGAFSLQRQRSPWRSRAPPPPPVH